MVSKRNNSGQVLIVVALVITMLLLSTALYITDAQKSQLKYTSESDLYLPFYKQGVRHTMISALVNISSGGDNSVLESNLNLFNAIILEQSYNAFFTPSFILSNTSPYVNGVWTTQNSSGTAIISAHTSFSVNSSGTSKTYFSEYDIEVSSKLEVTGEYQQIEAEKQVQLICKLSNEEQPALAKSFTFSYANDGSLQSENWTVIEDPNIVDHGNGTYTVAFTAITDQADDPVLVWVSCQDQRGIMLQTLVEPTGF